MAEVQQQLASSQTSASQLQEREAEMKDNLEGQASELAAVRCSLEEERRARSDVVTELASVSCRLEEQQQARSDAVTELQTVSIFLKHSTVFPLLFWPVLPVIAPPNLRSFPWKESMASASVEVQQKAMPCVG